MGGRVGRVGAVAPVENSVCVRLSLAIDGQEAVGAILKAAINREIHQRRLSSRAKLSERVLRAWR